MNLNLRDANAFVSVHHRHHKKSVRGCKFCLGVKVDGRLCGVAIVGRPVARCFDDGKTAELTRLCTDGTANAASFLLSKAKRAAQAVGFQHLLTYTLDSEGGASLRAAGWKQTHRTKGGPWDTPARPRGPTENPGRKVCWSANPQSETRNPQS